MSKKSPELMKNYRKNTSVVNDTKYTVKVSVTEDIKEESPKPIRMKLRPSSKR